MDSYCYPPDYSVLKNKLGLKSRAELDMAERLLVSQRMEQGCPEGNFDLAHLQAIHRHLFQDIYAWAGEIRTVEISKGGQDFQFRQFIGTGMADVHKRIVANHYLRNLTAGEFARHAGRIMGDVNYVHPFREGNGRTQLQYLEQLAERAGHPIDLLRLEPSRWIQASKESHAGDYALMEQCIFEALEAIP